MSADKAMPAVVLAGERPGGSALARRHGVAAGVLVELAGRTCLEHVIGALRSSRCIDGGLLVGPAHEVVEGSAIIRRLLDAGDFVWHEPSTGPSASALDAARHLERYPFLLTAGDHALLTPELVDHFCITALDQQADLIVGIVPYAQVHAAWPATRRTRLRFRDGACCGANLYLLRKPQALAALEFWQSVEVNRKRPWRIARRLGVGALLRYLSGRIDRATAFLELSQRTRADISWVVIDNPRAAIDVDSSADLELAERILSER